MICKDFEGLIEDYQDGRLDEELAASMQIHLGGCSTCSAALVSMRAEQRLYQGYREALEQGLEVPVGMWSRVRAGIETAGAVPPLASEKSAPLGLLSRWLPSFGGGHWVRQFGFAALLIVLSVAGTLIVVQYQRREASSARSPEPTVPAAQDAGGKLGQSAKSQASTDSAADDKSLQAAMQAIHRAERDYLEAIRLLSGIVEKRRPTLESGLVKALERNLRAIDENIEATRKACYAHPSDPYLAQYMLMAYSKKVELLQEIAL